MNRAITALAAHGLETVRPVYDAAPADNDGPGINPEEIGPAGNYADELLRKLSEASVPPRAQGDGRYSLADARDLLRQGYSLEHVCGATGWGRMWLQDLADRLAAS